MEGERWWCDSKRKALCWGVAFSTMHGYTMRLWMKKTQRQGGYTQTHTIWHVETHTHQKCTETWILFGEGNSEVWPVLSVCLIRLSTALMLPVLCLFGQCLSAPAVWQRQQQTAATQTRTHTHTHNLKISRTRFSLVNVEKLTFLKKFSN